MVNSYNKKIIKIRIIIQPATRIQEVAGKELWRRLSGNQPTGSASAGGLEDNKLKGENAK